MAVTKKKKEMPGSQLVLLNMVAYQCCGSEMFISYPDFFPIPHPGFRIRISGSQNALDGSRIRNAVAYQGQSCGSRASWCREGPGSGFRGQKSIPDPQHYSLPRTELWKSSLLMPWRSRRGSMGRREGSSTPFSIWKSSMAWQETETDH